MMKKDYSDIIDHPRYISPTHPQMNRENRAAQFMPFAALTGFEDAIDEAKALAAAECQLEFSTDTRSY